MHAEIDTQREEELEKLLGVVDGMDLDGSKRVRRPTVLDLKSAVEAAEQQSAKRLKAGSLDSSPSPMELQHTESQTAPLPRHYYDEPDPAKWGFTPFFLWVYMLFILTITTTKISRV